MTDMFDSTPPETEALAPCPLCGSAAEFVRDEDGDGSFVAVQCTGCGCETGKHYPIKDDARPNAANEWNRRAQPGNQPFAYMSKGGVRNWLQGDNAESHVLMRKPNDARLPLYLRGPEEQGQQEPLPIAVKPLAWIEARDLPAGWPHCDDVAEIWQGIGHGLVLALVIRLRDGTIRMAAFETTESFDSIEAAKASAQTLYAGEILSAIYSSSERGTAGSEHNQAMNDG